MKSTNYKDVVLNYLKKYNIEDEAGIWYNMALYEKLFPCYTHIQ